MNTARILELIHGQPSTLETPYAGDFDHDVHPSAERCIQPPIRTAEDDAYIASVRRWAVILALFSVGALIGLLRLFGARSFEA